MHDILEYLRKQSKRSLVVLCLLLVVLIGICDYLAGPEFGFSIFYLVPISLATWFAGITGGLITSVGCAVAWFVAKWIGGEGTFKPLVSFWNTTIRLGFFLVIVFLQRTLQQEQSRARSDFLTGIGNRRHFFELAESELERARRHPHPFTVVYLDLDNFKAVNDQFGHVTGDRLLRIATEIIRSKYPVNGCGSAPRRRRVCNPPSRSRRKVGGHGDQQTS